MTKKIIYTIISIVMIIAVMTGCHQGKETVSSVSTEPNTTAVTTTESASESTTAETTTKVTKPSTMNETTEKKTTESSTEKASTTKAYSTTTTTKKHTTTTTTKRVTTTQKPSITKKTTTTKKPTTTKATTTKHTHGAPCGNMGKWYNSRSELKDDYMRVSDYWLAKLDNGEIDWDTYVKNCPCGYECWSCGECGMWTGNYKY